MEVTSSSPHGVMSLSSYFDVSPTSFPWRSPRPEQIIDRRAALDDKLIFDILLVSGGIRDPDFLYPPRDAQGLERLLDAINSSTYDTLKKHTLIYFLLKWYQDGREDKFKIQFSIPPQFSALADAYWYLDSGIHIPKAVSILSDSRLNRDYASKIIHAIALTPQPGPLILKYVRTAKPPLVEPPDLLTYLVALAESSLLEAWQFQRSFSETDEIRPRLFKRILDWAIFPNMRANALKDFVSLPLSNYEQNLLNEHALKPPSDYDSTAISIIQDLVCVRYIQHGKYIDAIKLDRKFNAAGFDDSSDSNNNNGTVESSERKQMIRQLYESLSPVEKSLLDIEFNPSRREPQQPAGVGPAPASTEATKDVSMSQSWEEVSVPENLNKSTSTPLKNIQIPPAATGGVPSQPEFAVPTSTTTTAAAANASASPAPILPLSSSISGKPKAPSQSLSAHNGFTPRKSLPLSALGKGRPAFSGAGQRLSLGGSPGGPGITISSPASGIKFPVGSNKPQLRPPGSVPAGGQHGQQVQNPLLQEEQPKFVKTVDRENAFYVPPKPQKKAEQTTLKQELYRLRDESASEEEEEEEEEEEDDDNDDDERDEGKAKAKEKGKAKAGKGRKEDEDDQEDEDDDDDRVPGWKETAEENVRELNRSIFGNGGKHQQPHLALPPPPPQIPQPQIISSSSVRETRRTSAKQSRKEPASSSTAQPRKTKRQRQSAQQPPGAFGADDDHEDHDHEEQQHSSEPEPEPVHMTRSSRRSTAAGAQKRSAAGGAIKAQAREAAATSPTKPLRTRTRQVKKESAVSARRVPGSLMDDSEDDDDHHANQHEQEDEDDEDRLAPLRHAALSPPPPTASSRRPVRKARSVASEDAGSDDGIAVRKSTRRSSRLSTAGSARGASPESVKGETTTAKTATRKSGRSRKTKT